MKKLKRVRGGFLPRIPRTSVFKDKQLSGWTAKKGVSSSAAPLHRLQFGNKIISVKSRTGPGVERKTQTEPKLAIAQGVKKQVKTQTEGTSMRRRTLKYLPAVYRKKPSSPLGRRGGGGLSESVKPMGAGASRSYYTSGRKGSMKKFGISRMSPEQRWQNVQLFREVGGVGRQDAWSYDTGNLADLQAVVSGKLTNVLSQVVIKSYTVKTIYTNTASTNVFLDIYECVPRRAHALDAITAFDGGITRMAPTESSISILTTPFQSRDFTQNWLIKKVVKLELAPGRTHMHTCTHNINALYSSTVNLAGSTTSHQPKFTRTTLQVAYSELANTAAGVVSFPATSLNICRSEDIRWHFGESELKDLVYSGLPAPSIGTVGLQIYEEGSGAVEPVTAA